MKIIEFNKKNTEVLKTVPDSHSEKSEFPSRENTPEIVAKLNGFSSKPIKIVDFDKIKERNFEPSEKIFGKNKIKIIEFD